MQGGIELLQQLSRLRLSPWTFVTFHLCATILPARQVVLHVNWGPNTVKTAHLGWNSNGSESYSCQRPEGRAFLWERLPSEKTLCKLREKEVPLMCSRRHSQDGSDIRCREAKQWEMCTSISDRLCGHKCAHLIMWEYASHWTQHTCVGPVTCGGQHSLTSY